MKEITIKAYEFDELSDAAKKVARDWFRRASDGDLFWSEGTVEEVLREGEHLGIEFKRRVHHTTADRSYSEPCVWWSGFWSQGDGACFEGTWRASDVKSEKVAKDWGDAPVTTEIKRIAGIFAEIAKEFPQAWFEVTHRGHYSHKYCTEFDVTIQEGEQTITDDEWNKAHDALVENARDFMDWIYNQLEAAWEDHNSDAMVGENIRANGYLFTEDGSRTTTL